MGNMTVHLEETLKKAEEVLKGGKEYVLENPDDVIEQIYWLRYNAEMLKLMLSEEKGYRDWVQKNRIKGYCYGYLTRQAGSQMIAHQTAEKYEQEKIELRKLANNPILSEAAKKTLRRALWMVNLGLWEHNQLCRIREGEKDAVMPRVSSVEQRCGNCNKVIEMDGWKACPWCGKPIDWERWWKRNEID